MRLCLVVWLYFVRCFTVTPPLGLLVINRPLCRKSPALITYSVTAEYITVTYRRASLVKPAISHLVFTRSCGRSFVMMRTVLRLRLKHCTVGQLLPVK